MVASVRVIEKNNKRGNRDTEENNGKIMEKEEKERERENR